METYDIVFVMFMVMIFFVIIYSTVRDLKNEKKKAELRGKWNRIKELRDYDLQDIIRFYIKSGKTEKIVELMKFTGELYNLGHYKPIDEDEVLERIKEIQETYLVDKEQWQKETTLREKLIGNFRKYLDLYTENWKCYGESRWKAVFDIRFKISQMTMPELEDLEVLDRMIYSKWYEEDKGKEEKK